MAVKIYTLFTCTVDLSARGTGTVRVFVFLILTFGVVKILEAEKTGIPQKKSYATFSPVILYAWAYVAATSNNGTTITILDISLLFTFHFFKFTYFSEWKLDIVMYYKLTYAGLQSKVKSNVNSAETYW